MSVEKTLIMIKPNAVKKNAIGAIIQRFEAQGLQVIAARLEHMSPETCRGFYAEHEGKFFFDGLVEFMSSGTTMLLAFYGENAIDRAREIMGNTDPSQAAPGTIRADFADSMTENAVHGSDSPDSAARELGFHFTPDQVCMR